MADETPSIIRGTTPTVTCTVGMDLTDYSCYLAIGPKARKPWLVADNTQMELTVDGGESVLAYTLTQEQTLSCKAGAAYVQLRVIKDGTALASDWGALNVGDIIEDGEIADEYDTD